MYLYICKDVCGCMGVCMDEEEMDAWLSVPKWIQGCLDECLCECKDGFG